MSLALFLIYTYELSLHFAESCPELELDIVQVRAEFEVPRFIESTGHSN